jgi:hypothetical protein
VQKINKLTKFFFENCSKNFKRREKWKDENKNKLKKGVKVFISASLDCYIYFEKYIYIKWSRLEN